MINLDDLKGRSAADTWIPACEWTPSVAKSVLNSRMPGHKRIDRKNWLFEKCTSFGETNYRWSYRKGSV
jgi:hypothetical protein